MNYKKITNGTWSDDPREPYVEDRVRKEDAMNPFQRLFASVTSLFGALNFEELSIY